MASRLKELEAELAAGEERGISSLHSNELQKEIFSMFKMVPPNVAAPNSIYGPKTQEKIATMWHRVCKLTGMDLLSTVKTLLTLSIC